MSEQLAKIERVTFGVSGYQEAMIGLHLQFSFPGGGVCSDKSCWDPELVECSNHANWTEEERGKQLEQVMRFLSETLKKAKVKSVTDLQGIPVALTFDGEGFAGSTLKSWRILEEVL